MWATKNGEVLLDLSGSNRIISAESLKLSPDDGSELSESCHSFTIVFFSARFIGWARNRPESLLVYALYIPVNRQFVLGISCLRVRTKKKVPGGERNESVYVKVRERCEKPL